MPLTQPGNIKQILLSLTARLSPKQCDVFFDRRGQFSVRHAPAQSCNLTDNRCNIFGWILFPPLVQTVPKFSDDRWQSNQSRGETYFNAVFLARLDVRQDEQIYYDRSCRVENEPPFHFMILKTPAAEPPGAHHPFPSINAATFSKIQAMTPRDPPRFHVNNAGVLECPPLVAQKIWEVNVFVC